MKNILLLFLFIISILAVSCSKDDSENTKSSQKSALYNEVKSEVRDYLKSHEDATIEDIQSILDKYVSSVTYEIENEVIYIQIDSIYELICDPYEKNIVKPIEGKATEVDVDSLMNEINNVLYPNGNQNQVRNGTRQNNNKTRASNDPILLNKRNVLIWDPMGMNTRLDFGIATTSRSLNDLSTFSNYDIVVMFCHGERSTGMSGVSASLSSIIGDGNFEEDDCVDGISGTGDKCEDLIWIKEAKLRQLIGSNDLSETIVFMNMCHSDTRQSQIKKILNDNHVAAFAGANNIMDNSCVDFVASFANRFYNERALASNIIMELFGRSNNSSPIRKTYTTSSGYSGTYSFYYNQDLMYEPIVTGMTQIENQPRASITLPYELANRSMATRGINLSRSSSSRSISAGFWIRNKETGNVIELDFSKSNVRVYARYDYEKKVSRVEVLGITDDMEEGTYEYCAYLNKEGKKEYSDEIYEFTISRINQVVPQWILDMMEPHIPIYKGNNPPVLDGMYAISPMKLSYNSNSSSSYKPGHIFADTFVYFSGQNQQNNTLDYYGFSMNDSGKVLSESVGPGAFISGEGENFSIFFNTEGVGYYSDGTTTSKTALIISGTKESVGIRNIYYAFVMIEKYDPYNHLMSEGEFRVFVDGDSFADRIEVNDATRSGCPQVNNYSDLPIPIENNFSNSYRYSGINYDVWKNQHSSMFGHNVH